ncbi:rod shape-determining protein MreC [Microscilla marina]|uniref:Cell shape-determining protein MreC n=1 Tax=Microscilla marina ATCC 23134 TaxID=313606 RepID=A1ZQX3_MICM2|nr:rod shape-determining protein MreC [Microscilla marina]EAY27278.1 rod shape-determining protein MreC [Microscilla marina ATCC 23134]
MQSLFLLIKRFRTPILFLLLEIFCLILIVTRNKYQNTIFYNISSEYTGQLLGVSNSVWEYFNLRDVNEKLAQENAQLRYLVAKKQFAKNAQVVPIRDSLIVAQYQYDVAKVVNNSTHKHNNYLTINRGSLHGIKPGMGVISPEGAVGKIKSCSKHYSIVVSLLHSKMRISSEIKKNNSLGYIQWQGGDPSQAKMLDVPRHLNVVEKDTIVTSGYNSTFPAGITIGVVKKVGRKAEETFFDIDVQLATEFNQLSYVYVIKNRLKLEQESLERESFEDIDE